MKKNKPELFGESTTREKVLKNIRHALIEKTDMPFPDVSTRHQVYPVNDDLPEVVFARELNEAGGHFIFCQSVPEMMTLISKLANDRKWRNIWCEDEAVINMLKQAGLETVSGVREAKDAQIAVTGCEFLLSRTGSVVVSSKMASGRRLNILPKNHLVIAFTSQMLSDINQAVAEIRKKYSQLPSLISVISGPSKTTAIGNTTVYGVHGPQELYVFMIDDIS